MIEQRPTFLGIGAQKAGTTWLHKQLTQHPEIWMPPRKEIHFFDRLPTYPSPNTLATASPLMRVMGSAPWEREKIVTDILRIAKYGGKGNFKEAIWHSRWALGTYDKDWYVGLFSQAVDHSICGEITPSYSILNSKDIAHIKVVNPDIKLIFMIRNPIERAWSHIRFDAGKGHLKVNLDCEDEIIAALKEPVVTLRNDYQRTINAYLEHFDSSQILVCFYDAITHDPGGLMSDITSFLKISPFQENTVSNKTRFNASKPKKIPTRVQEYLLEKYSPMLTQLAALLGSYANTWQEAEQPLEELKQKLKITQLEPTVHP